MPDKTNIINKFAYMYIVHTRCRYIGSHWRRGDLERRDGLGLGIGNSDETNDSMLCSVVCVKRLRCIYGFLLLLFSSYLALATRMSKDRTYTKKRIIRMTF